VRLDREVARAALQQRDVAGGEAVEVRGLQPLVEVLGGLLPIGTTTSTGCTGAVTSPLPEYW
jgi:hypothetical protein